MVFATTVNVSLGWLRGRVVLAAALGAVGGICSYAGGRRLGAGAFDLIQPETVLALVMVWGVGVPLLLHATELLDAVRRVIARVGEPTPARSVWMRIGAVHGSRRALVRAASSGRVSSGRGMISR